MTLLSRSVHSTVRNLTARTKCQSNMLSASMVHSTSRRSFATGVKMLDQRGKAQENLYFSQEDEKLLKKLLEANPDLDGKVNLSGDSVEEKIKLVFLNHGIPPLNKKLIKDLAGVLEEKK